MHRWHQNEKALIYQDVIDLLLAGDGEGIKQIFGQYETIEEKVKLWTIFNSWERAAIKVYLEEN